MGAIAGSLVYNSQNWGWGLTFSQVRGCPEALLPIVQLSDDKLSAVVTHGWQVAFAAGMLPVLFLFPLLPSLVESSREDECQMSVRTQLKNIWETVRAHRKTASTYPMLTTLLH